MKSILQFMVSLVFSSAVTWAYWGDLKSNASKIMFFCGQLSIGMSLSEMF